MCRKRYSVGAGHWPAPTGVSQNNEVLRRSFIVKSVQLVRDFYKTVRSVRLERDRQGIEGDLDIPLLQVGLVGSIRSVGAFIRAGHPPSMVDGRFQNCPVRERQCGPVAEGQRNGQLLTGIGPLLRDRGNRLFPGGPQRKPDCGDQSQDQCEGHQDQKGPAQYMGLSFHLTAPPTARRRADNRSGAPLPRW